MGGRQKKNNSLLLVLFHFHVIWRMLVLREAGVDVVGYCRRKASTGAVPSSSLFLKDLNMKGFIFCFI